MVRFTNIMHLTLHTRQVPQPKYNNLPNKGLLIKTRSSWVLPESVAYCIKVPLLNEYV